CSALGRVFEIAPSATRLFSFLRDSNVPLDKNPKLKSHAISVFTMVTISSSFLPSFPSLPFPSLPSTPCLVAGVRVCDTAEEERQGFRGRDVVEEVGRHSSQVRRRQRTFRGYYSSKDRSNRWVVRSALLDTIEHAVPEMWCPEMSVAWGEAYDHLAAALKEEMRLLSSS
ncbi:hypothetical protein B296_00024699, partial [Ensete ventricosum]